MVLKEVRNRNFISPVVTLFFAFFALALVSLMIGCFEENKSTAKKEDDKISTSVEASNYLIPWANDEWTSFAVKEFEGMPDLMNIVPLDYREFCDPFPSFEKRPIFYTFLMAEMTRWESNFDPKAITPECRKNRCVYSGGCNYKEGYGYCMKGGHALDNYIPISRGLLQLSLESVQYYGCKDLKAPVDLNDPIKNISCGTILFSNFITKDISISDIDGDGKWNGLSKYWAVLRGTTSYTRDSLVGIKEATKGFCKNLSEVSH